MTNDPTERLNPVNKRVSRLALTAAATLTLAGAATAVAEVRGSGATFPRIAYQVWCQDSGGACSYTPKGSTGGINDFINGTVDFGGTDAPLTTQQQGDLSSKRGGSGVLYFPTLLGAVTVPTNVQGQPGALQLRGKTLGQIFSGVITNWNDARIAADNANNPRLKGFKFPNQPIVTCVRQEGSGTSYNFSVYLWKASADFKAKVVIAQSPNWAAPNIIKAQGNAGVAACVSQNSGAIGYVDLGDARAAGLGPKLAAVGKSEVITVPRIVKGKRKMVTIRRLVYMPPSVPAIQRAGDIASIPSNLVLDLTNSPAKAAYPIAITTYVLAYTDFNAAGKGGSLAGVKGMLNYFYSTGEQSKLSGLGFAPLPPKLLAAAKAQMSKLR